MQIDTMYNTEQHYSYMRHWWTKKYCDGIGHLKLPNEAVCTIIDNVWHSISSNKINFTNLWHNTRTLWKTQLYIKLNEALQNVEKGKYQLQIHPQASHNTLSHTNAHTHTE